MGDEGKSDKPEAQATTPKPVMFNHRLASDFRTYHADGAWSVISHQGNLNLNFYNELPAMAQTIIAPVDVKGQFTGETKMIGAGESDANFYSITRDMQCNVVLSLPAAIGIRDQLNHFISRAEELLKQSANKLSAHEEK